MNAKGKGNVRKLGLSDTYSDQSGAYFLFTDGCLTIEMFSFLLAGFQVLHVVFANNTDYTDLQVCQYFSHVIYLLCPNTALANS